MIRTLHLTLPSRVTSIRLARRLVCRDCRHTPQTQGTSSTFTISTRAKISSRTFSSSRPYATTLYSENTPSTSSHPDSPVLLRNETVLMSIPSKDALDPDEELIEGPEARFQISARAAEVRLAGYSYSVSFKTLNICSLAIAIDFFTRERSQSCPSGISGVWRMSRLSI